MTDLGFFLAAAVTLGGALLVVRAQNLVRAVLWLGVALVATAALYAMLDASFLAGVQVLVYVGGVVTLMIFGVMITRRHEGLVVLAESHGTLKGAAVAGGLFAVMALAIHKTPGLDGPVPPRVSTAEIGRALLSTHVLAFEAVSFLLLAAIVGAIVIARKKDPTPVPERPAPTHAAHPAAHADAHGAAKEVHP